MNAAGAQLGFSGSFGSRPQPPSIVRVGLHPAPPPQLNSQAQPKVCVAGCSKSSVAVKINLDNSDRFGRYGHSLTDVPFVLGWRDRPSLKPCRCLQPLVTLVGRGCYLPTLKSMPLF